MIRVTSNPCILLNNFQDYLRYRTQYFDSALLITLVLVSLYDLRIMPSFCYMYVCIAVLIQMEEPSGLLCLEQCIRVDFLLAWHRTQAHLWHIWPLQLPTSLDISSTWIMTMDVSSYVAIYACMTTKFNVYFINI